MFLLPNCRDEIVTISTPRQATIKRKAKRFFYDEILSIGPPAAPQATHRIRQATRKGLKNAKQIAPVEALKSPNEIGENIEPDQMKLAKILNQ